MTSENDMKLLLVGMAVDQRSPGLLLWHWKFSLATDSGDEKDQVECMLVAPYRKLPANPLIKRLNLLIGRLVLFDLSVDHGGVLDVFSRLSQEPQ